MDAQAKGSKPEQGRGNIWIFSEESFIRFEALLRKHRLHLKRIWNLRAEAFGTLVTAEPKRPLRHQFSFIGGLLYAILAWVRARRKPGSALQLPAAFVLSVVGDSSKEMDMARSLAPELLRYGQSVAILHDIPSGKPNALAEEFPRHYHRLPEQAIYRVSGRMFLSSLFNALGMAGSLLSLAVDAPGIVPCLIRNGGSLLLAFLEQGLAEDFLSRCLARDTLRGVAMVTEGTPFARALVNCAHRLNAQAFQFLHGFPHLLHAVADSDHVFCFSSVERGIFLSYGWPEASVHACGHCRGDIVRKDIASRRETMSLGGGLRILFAEQGIEGSYALDCYRQTVSCVFAGALKAGLTTNEFRIRIHPRSDRNRFEEIAITSGFQDVGNYVSQHPLVDDLAWANVVATAWSTMAVEAAWADACLIWLPVGSFVFGIRQQLVAAGYGIEAANAEEFAQWLGRLRDPVERQAAAGKLQSAARRLAICSPTAVRDSVNLMLNPGLKRTDCG